MSKQNYNNHIRFYYPHHFIFYPLVAFLIAACIYLMGKIPDEKILFGAMAVMLVLLAWLSFMMRQHYALNNQNRIVRLEMRLRYFQLTGKPFEPLEQRLSFGQIAALRFASGEELLPLIERAINEPLSPDAIKKSITVWVPDDMRV
ncbi:MAG: hypothetical protein EOP51_08960 [Sphingobacteriales bacterium]|nr:MAG: hypothetical protein EOP51_08960 [Sphingobacteriales bacterium]